MGQQVQQYENLLNRGFHADGPNRKWVTWIPHIHTKQGVLYLSMIRDLYDNSIVAYKTGTEQTVGLVLYSSSGNEARKKGRCRTPPPQRPGISVPPANQPDSSIRHYTVHVRKGNPYDNAMAENFFSILKTECIYRQEPASFPEANKMIDRYIHFYNHERIQLKMERRRLRDASPTKPTFLPGLFFVLSA